MYWRSNSATTSPFFTLEPGFVASCSTSMNSPPPPPAPPPPPPPAPPVPMSELDVEPRLLLEELLLGDDVDEDEEEEVLPAPEPVDEVGVRLIREVEFRKACDPPPTFWPFVEVIEGAADAEEVEESPDDIPPPPPLLPPPTEVPVPRDCRAP